MSKRESKRDEEKISKFLLYDQHQELLLPKSVQEYIPENHIARTVSHIIDRLDITSLIRSYDPEGAPAYHPHMMLKVLIYGMLIGIRSSRKIEALLHDSLVFMYLSGRQAPDFCTICRFRRDHLGEITGIFDQVVELCVQLDMISEKDVFCDGTKVKAHAALKHSKTKKQIKKEIKKLKKEVRKMLKEVENTDKKEDSLFGNNNPYTGEGKKSSLLNRIERLEQACEKIEENSEAEREENTGSKGTHSEPTEDSETLEDHLTPTEEQVNGKTEETHPEQKKEKEKKINSTDFDAHIMQFSDKTLRPAYNGEVAVDGKENVIVACHLTDEATDHHQLQPLIEHARENGIHPDNVGADAGFFSYDNTTYLEGKGITGYIPDHFFAKEEKKETKKFRKSRFCYNEKTDSYTCPAGNTLSFHHIQRREGKPDLRVYQGNACSHCPLKEKCTTADYRTVSRDPREYLKETMRTRLKTEKGKEMKVQRSTKVESVFGNMKHNKKFTQFLLRGKQYAAIEFILMCTALNIEKIFTHLVSHQKDVVPVLQGIT
jgi:transposase